jgi:ketosteroid isomerase-like protein
MDKRRAGRPLLHVPRGLPGPGEQFLPPPRSHFPLQLFLGPKVRVRISSSRLVLYCASALAPLAAPATQMFAQSHGDSTAVAAVVERYHRALAEGDSATAVAQLADDAVILESGSIESREEYRSHHLPADIAFARAVKGTRSPVRVSVQSNVAWTTATSTTQGKFRGKPVNSVGAELIILTRSKDGWKIRAIHWSSRNLR